MDVLSVRVPARQPPRPPLFRGGRGQEPAPVSPAASEEYYQLLASSESHGCGADVPSYTVREIERATSEFIVKNAVSVPPEACPTGARPSSIRPSRRPGGWSSPVNFQEVTSFLKKKVKSVVQEWSRGLDICHFLRHVPSWPLRLVLRVSEHDLALTQRGTGRGWGHCEATALCPGLQTRLMRL